MPTPTTHDDTAVCADSLEPDTTESDTTESDTTEPDTTEPDTADSPRSRWRPRATGPRIALVLGLTAATALVSVIGFMAVREHRAQQAADLRAEYLQVGRQGAVNLTTIDWHHAEADVQRILDVATGPFYDDFSQRSQPFVEVVKKVQSISTGTVTVAGLESATDDGARVLVAMNVQTTTNESPQQSSRDWRMRISVQRTGNDVKVSNVEFIP